LIEVPGPQIIQPVLVGVKPSSPIQSDPEGTKPVAVQHGASDVRSGESSVQKQLTPHVPLISLDQHDIEDLPPDAFDITFPPFVTVVPQLFTMVEVNGSEVQETGGATEVARPAGVEETEIRTTEPTALFTSVKDGPDSTPASKVTPSSSQRHPIEDIGEVEKTKPVEIDFNIDEHMQTPGEKVADEPETSTVQQSVEIQPTQVSLHPVNLQILRWPFGVFIVFDVFTPNFFNGLCPGYKIFAMYVL
uniref:Titin n=1 Tax=Gongylonema pulchrum TaxID=637853 RepID=A0A183D6I0_9BILA